MNNSWCCDPGMVGVDISGSAVRCTPLGATLSAGWATASLVVNALSICTSASTTPAETSAATAKTTTGAPTSASSQATTASLGGGGPSSPTTSSIATTSMPATVSSVPHSLSTGVISGIAVGTVAGAALVLFSAWWFCMRARNRRYVGAFPVAGQGQMERTQVESSLPWSFTAYKSYPDTTNQVYEMGESRGGGVYELYSHPVPSEI